MAARKWTPEQKARQSEAIHRWRPWEQSTGPTTDAGKAASSKNAFNCALREVMRELTRSNRALLAYLNGSTPTAPSHDRATIDRLLDELSTAPLPTASKRRKQAADPKVSQGCGDIAQHLVCEP